MYYVFNYHTANITCKKPASSYAKSENFFQIKKSGNCFLFGNSGQNIKNDPRRMIVINFIFYKSIKINYD